MFLRIIGASCVLAVCGGIGFVLAEKHMKETHTLRQLIGVLDYMESELLFHLSPLPILCRQAAKEVDGVLERAFTSFALELENQVSPNVDVCMRAAVSKIHDLPEISKYALIQLGSQLGRFDLQGQVKEIETVRCFCRAKLKELDQNKDKRVRGYKTLGLCAGAALVILFM